MKRRLVVLGAIAVQVLLLVTLLYFARRSAPHVFDDLVEKVPAARDVLSFRGQGFGQARAGSRFDSAVQSAKELRSIRATAPAHGSGSFEVGQSNPWRPFRFLMPGARDVDGKREAGLVTYANAYPGVDVLVARDPAQLELAYVVRDPASKPDLRMRFDSGVIVIEREHGSATISLAKGDTRRLQADRPVAFDAQGRRREGRYRTEGRDLIVEMDLNGLAPPVLVDPTFYIPFWTIANDSRQPANEIYTPENLSRETQVVLDGSTGTPTLIRPIRSQQSEDNASTFGTLWQPGYSRVQPVPRTSGVQGPTLDSSNYLEWTRVHGSQSEVWTWHDGRWRLQADTGLPGIIDAAIGYDTARGRLVAFGGGAPAFTCIGTATTVIPAVCTPSSTWPWDATYERGSNGTWTAKRIANSPSPRVRAAMTSMGEHMVLFGGRAIVLQPTQSRGRSPDTFAAELLNDTWTYDGTSWTRVPAGNPPPAQEGSQLVLDARRGRMVLVGGSTGPVQYPHNPLTGLPGQQSGDSLSLWEFDGTDWLQRFGPNDPALPAELRGRRGVAAAWHPTRQTVVLFGGFVDSLPPCPYSGLALENAQAQTRSEPFDPVFLQQLEAQNCIRGYVHDWWEWDGDQIRQLARAAFAGYVGEAPLPSRRLALYRQVQGDIPPVGAGPGGSAASVSKLWPWRYDPRPDHFRLRTALERSFTTPQGDAPPGAATGTSTTLGEPSGTPGYVSPSFVPEMRPHLVYEPAAEKFMVMASPTPREGRGGSRVFSTGMNTWEEQTPRLTPFDTGLNDFFAATWDTTANRALLFDPRDGSTWEFDTASSWRPAQVASNLPPWSGLPLPYRVKKELEGEIGRPEVAPKMPRMTFDRGRGIAILLHNGTLWELTGGAWQSRPLPTAMSNCVASTLMTYDHARQRSVLVGCGVPAQTWEWDGSQWYGPFPSPYDALVERAREFFPSWIGPLQLPWVHPNAIAELPSLGGVGLLDIDGTLRVWNGQTWSSGPKLPEGHTSDAAALIIARPFDYGTLASSRYFQNLALPQSPFPPLLEDTGSQRVLAFRDGVTGLRQIDLRQSGETRSWSRLILGRSIADPWNANLAYPSVHPHPLELWSPEHVEQLATSDPARKLTSSGDPLPNGTEQLLVSLYWPFRILQDAPRNRVFFLTHRGALWQFGNEPVGGIGDACTTVNDCGEGFACVRGVCSRGELGDVCDTRNDCANSKQCIDGVCCNDSACGTRCNTCNGSQPGICEEIAAGLPDPKGRCGSGTCAGLCPGFGTIDPFHGTQLWVAQACLFPAAGQQCGPTSCDQGMFRVAGSCSLTSPSCQASTADPTPCAGGLGCATPTTCKPTCTSRADCRDRFSTCSPDGQSCVPDRVASIAGELGILIVDWQEPRRRTPAEVRDILRDAGLKEDDAGTFILPVPAFGGVQLGFDPDLKSPAMGLRTCLQHIEACIEFDHTFDECVAVMPRCQSPTPWQGDPAGNCCPEACLVEYLERRRTKNERQAVDAFFSSGCYPGLNDSIPDGGAP